MKIKIHKLDQSVDIPKFETTGSVGFDLAASEDITIGSGKIALIPTGLVIETPKGYALILASRSSTPKKKGLTMPHSIGVIDQDYCGPKDEVKIQMRNFTDSDVLIKKGEKIAQGLFVRVETCEFEEIDKIENETRGGFGSTG